MSRCQSFWLEPGSVQRSREHQAGTSKLSPYCRNKGPECQAYYSQLFMPETPDTMWGLGTKSAKLPLHIFPLPPSHQELRKESRFGEIPGQEQSSDNHSPPSQNFHSPLSSFCKFPKAARGTPQSPRGGRGQTSALNSPRAPLGGKNRRERKKKVGGNLPFSFIRVLA